MYPYQHVDNQIIPSNITLRLCKRLCSQSNPLTQPQLFFQLMYVQTPRLTDCFLNISQTPFERDPGWKDTPKKKKFQKLHLILFDYLSTRTIFCGWRIICEICNNLTHHIAMLPYSIYCYGWTRKRSDYYLGWFCCLFL